MSITLGLRDGLKSLLAPQLNTTSLDHLIPHFPPTQGIPKKLFHVYVGRELGEPLITQLLRLGMRHNIGWDQRIYNDHLAEEFISEEYGPEILKRYRRIDPAYGPARADLLRYLLIYRYGGVYLDVKSFAELDKVIRPTDQYLLAYWPEHRPMEWKMHDELREVSPKGELQMWFIAARAGHPFLRRVIGRVLANIDRYSPALHAAGKKGVVRVTGPIAYTLAIHPVLDQHPHRFIDTDACGWQPHGGRSDTAHESPSHYSRLRHPVVRTSSVRQVLGQVVAAKRRLA